jgi:hypothetical protein
VRLTPRHPISSKIAFIGGVTLAGAVAAAMLVQWLTATPRVPADSAPYRLMALDAAAGLALGTAGLIALWRRFRRVAAAAGILAALVGAVSLAEQSLGLGGGVPLLSVPMGPARLALSEGPLSPLAALEFLALGMALAAAAATRAARRRTLILATFGSIVAAVAALPGLGLLSAALAKTEVGRLQGLSAGSALGLLACGMAMLALGRWAAPEPRAAPDAGQIGDAAPLAGLAFGVLVTLTFLSFQWIANGLQAEMRAKFSKESTDLVDDIGDRMPTYALAMRGSAHYLQQVGASLLPSGRRTCNRSRSSRIFPAFSAMGSPAACLPRACRRTSAGWRRRGPAAIASTRPGSGRSISPSCCSSRPASAAAG